MSISYCSESKRFIINTENTTYAMQLELDRFLVHLYYGKRTDNLPEIEKLPDRGFTPYPSYVCDTQAFGERFSLNLRLLEVSGFDSGDYRSDSVRVKNADGNSVTSFEYLSHEIIKGRKNIPGLPFADADNDTETLCITLRDEISACELDLYYTVFPKEDTISRYMTLRNTGKSAVVLENAASLMLDLPHSDCDVISFYGNHANERNMQRNPVIHGKMTLESRRGATGAQMNNSFAVVAHNATETAGEAIGFSFVYSGCFLNSVEVEQSSSVRVKVGLHPDFFSWTVDPDDSFTTPEAVMTYSASGIGQMSRNLHRFTRNHIVRPCNTPRRPVVLNTWEGNFFDIDEHNMEEYAKYAAECGFDMLVMDDGWFGKRLSDNAGLGDWWANPDRFKDGLPPFVRRIKSHGIRFGIWIEPEMVNPDSDLYRAHPDWALAATGRDHQRSRQQLVLDFANPDVLDYLKNIFKKTFTDVPLDYIKWDFNRHLCQIASTCIPADRQGEAAHRFMLGVYDLYQWFCDEYPGVMIENCSGGGGRYDLAMMKYSSQIWTSDNTDPVRRIFIQYGSTMMYPACVMSCHVSNHSDSVEDDRLLDFGYKVALQGVLGYEFDITKISDKARKAISRQIAEYRNFEHVIENGELYRLMSPYDDGKSAFYYITEDKSEVLVYFYQIHGEEPTEYRLPIDVPAGEMWIARFNRNSEYTSEELQNGLIVRSSSEDNYAEMFHFVRRGEKPAEKCEAHGCSKCEETTLTENEKKTLESIVSGQDKFASILRNGKLYRLDLHSDAASAFCYAREDGSEYLLCFCQNKPETPRQYRLSLDVPADSSFKQTHNNPYGLYSGNELRVGLVADSTADGNAFKLFHLVREK